MKVVINDCYGGFGLSDEGLARYAEIKGITLDKDFYHRDIARDPAEFPNGNVNAKKVYAICCTFKVKANEYDRHKANELCENLATMFAIKHNVSWEIWQRIRENKKFAEHLVKLPESYVKSLTKDQMDWLVKQYEGKW